MQWIWKRVLKGQAKSIQDRLTFGVLGRAAVKRSPDGEISLLYYPRNDSRDLAELSQPEIEVGHSQNDVPEKLASGIPILLLLMLPSLDILLRISKFDVLVMVGQAALAWLVAAAFAGVVVVGTLFWLRTHFAGMETEWQNAIRRLFDSDIRSKIFGIRDSLRSLRRFMKWRRFMQYFLWAAGTALSAQVLLIVAATLFGGEGMNGFWSGYGLAFLFVAVLLQAAVLEVYSYLWWYFTDNRDPSMQMSVMLAEENRAYVAAFQRRT